MDATFDNYKKILERVRVRLLESPTQAGSIHQGNMQNDQDNDQALQPGQVNSMAEKLQRVDASLERIANGVYGCCIKCGAKIQPDRLHNLPYAEYCLPCQRQHENNVKRHNLSSG